MASAELEDRDFRMWIEIRWTCHAPLVRWLWVLVFACSAPSVRPAPSPGPAKLAPQDDCPDEAEDVDGFRDEDGCPDPDNDQDRIADTDDKCPNEPETYNGTDDDDGCPDKGCVLVKQFPMCVDDRIYFAQGAAVEIAASTPVLDAIASTMKQIAEIELVELRGFRSSNEREAVSQLRAASVRDALVKRGVEASRLVVVDGGVEGAGTPAGQRRVVPSIAKQHLEHLEEADVIECTPMGRFYSKLTEAEKRARCR